MLVSVIRRVLIGIVLMLGLLTPLAAQTFPVEKRYVHAMQGQSVFELARGGHHDHIVCVKCGKVVEFMDEVIEERQRDIAEENGFTIEDHALVIYGLCSDPDCRKSEAEF